MSLSISIRPFDRAKETIRNFAETNQDTSVVVTKALEIVDRWGPVRKFFCCCWREEYLRQLDPAKSSLRFREGLEIILSSKEFKSNVALKDVCERACATFNRLIRETNKELPSNRQVFDEKQLCVNLEEEISRIASQEKKPIRRTKLVRGDTAEAFTREDYDRILGDTTESPLQPIRLSPGKKDPSLAANMFHANPLLGHDGLDPQDSSSPSSSSSKSDEHSSPEMGEAPQNVRPPLVHFSVQVSPPAEDPSIQSPPQTEKRSPEPVESPVEPEAPRAANVPDEEDKPRPRPRRRQVSSPFTMSLRKPPSSLENISGKTKHSAL